MTPKHFITCFFLFAQLAASAQIIYPQSPLDSSDFPKAFQWKWWNKDAEYIEPFEDRTNFLIFLHRNLLPRYYAVKKEIKTAFSPEQKALLAKLDSAYSEHLHWQYRRNIGKDPDFNQHQPIMIRLNFVIIHETLDVYPDVYAVLAAGNTRYMILENIHPLADWELYTALQVYQKSEALRRQHRAAFETFNQEYTETFEAPKSFGRTMQGTLTPEDRAKFDWVNFLLWCYRS